VAKTGERHTWNESDDIIAYYLYRTRWGGAPTLPLNKKEIAKMLGMSEASLIMRQANFASLNGKGGLSPDHSWRLKRCCRMARDGRAFGWRLGRGLAGFAGCGERARTGARGPVGQGGRAAARSASSRQLA